MSISYRASQPERPEQDPVENTQAADTGQQDDFSLQTFFTKTRFGAYKDEARQFEEKVEVALDELGMSPEVEADKDVLREKEIFEKINSSRLGHAATLKEVFGLIAQHARASAIAQGLARVAESASALGSFFYGAKLFRSFETLYQGGSPGPEFFQDMGMMLALGAVSLFRPISDLLRTKFYNRLDEGLQADIMSAQSSRRLSELHSRKVRTEVTLVQEHSYSAYHLAGGVLDATGSVVEVGIAGSLLGYLSYQTLGPGFAVAMTGILALSTVPRLMSELRHTMATIKIAEKLADLQRKYFHLRWSLLESTSAYEARKLGREGELSDRAIALYKKMNGISEDEQAHHTKQSYYADSIERGTALGCAAVFLLHASGGHVPPEVLGVAFGALFRFKNALGMIGHSIGQNLKNLEFSRQVFGFLRESERLRKVEEKRRTLSLPFDGPPRPIHVKNLRFTYEDKDTPAIDGISFTVASGEFVAIVGPNGCGKSTLCKLLRGDYPPEEGAVYYGDTDIERVRWKDLCSYVASTGQDSRLFTSISIEENIEFGAPQDREGIPLEESLEKGVALSWVKRLSRGIRTIIGSGFRGGQEVSSGQYQTLLASRTIRSGARILVLDEPGAHLDPEKEARLARNLDQMNDGATTRILVTHDLKSAAKRADRIIVLKEGGLIDQVGTHEELMRTNRWYKESFKILDEKA